jgi:hypothetical protein
VRRLPQADRSDRARLRELRRRRAVPCHRARCAHRPSGALDGKSFDDLSGLSQNLRDHPQLNACLVKRVYGWATGGPTQPSDKPMLGWLGEQFAAYGYRLPDLMRTVALSSAFTTVRENVPEQRQAAAPDSNPSARAAGGNSR